MSFNKLNAAKSLKNTSSKLGGLLEDYSAKVSHSSIDKYNLKFGGDSRFSVFKVDVFLDCHTGSYGSSSCSTMISVDNKTASIALNKVLNKHMKMILDEMALSIAEEAKKLVSDAKAELEEATKFLDEIDGL
tara:strand:- start:1063 stop:1458 length:396 start_codon:yes stop_codon:yes gene_type:complete